MTLVSLCIFPKTKSLYGFFFVQIGHFLNIQLEHFSLRDLKNYLLPSSGLECVLHVKRKVKIKWKVKIKGIPFIIIYIFDFHVHT